MSSTKKCPFCAEDVLVAAIKCKHCGEMLGARVDMATVEHVATQTLNRSIADTYEADSTRRKSGRSMAIAGLFIVLGSPMGCDLNGGVGFGMFLVGSLMVIFGALSSWYYST